MGILLQKTRKDPVGILPNFIFYTVNLHLYSSVSGTKNVQRTVNKMSHI
jgi:hypothetical protein